MLISETIEEAYSQKETQPMTQRNQTSSAGTGLSDVDTLLVDTFTVLIFVKCFNIITRSESDLFLASMCLPSLLPLLIL